MGVTTILDSLAARSYTTPNVSTLASFGQSAPLRLAIIFHWQYGVIVDVLSVIGWHVHFALYIDL